MSDRLYDFSGERAGVVTIPTIWVAVVLSLIIHLAVLWEWLPKLRLALPQDVELGERSLVVRLAPPPGPPPSPPPAPSLPRARSSPESPPLKAAPRPRAAAPPVIAVRPPVPAAPSLPSTAPPVPAPPPSRIDGDLASYVEARRRARADPAPAAPAASPVTAPPTVEDAKARAERLAAANLGSQRPLPFGYDPARGGGIFTIQRLGFDNAEFMFYGWNKNVERNTAQLIEVRRGVNSDIRIAVVRRMIAIIREHEHEDFIWESKRLGRNVSLSARARDNEGLEEFLLREFFDDPRQPQLR